MRFVWPLAVLVGVSVSAQAQTTQPAEALQPGNSTDSLVRLGPLSLQPRVRLSNLGLDTNVFNSAAAPTRDVSATLVPSLESVLRAGRTVTTSRTSAEVIYFKKARGQRSFAFSQEGRFDVFLARLTPFATAARLTTHQRPNLEIDQRVEQTRTSVGGGSSFRAGARTRFTVAHERQRLQFNRDEDATLASLLDRRVALTSAAIQVALTPLTTLVVRGESQLDRFEETATRDSDSAGVVAGFELEPFALISGTALVGYRRVNARDAQMPDFSGVVASVNVSYVFRGAMLVNVTAGRGVEYSVDSNEPYYISTGGTVTARQALGTRWDVLVRAGRNTLSYQALRVPGVAEPVSARMDEHVHYGAGLGFRVGSTMRIGVDVSYEERRSPIAARQYDGVRAGGTLSYGY